MVGSGGLMIWAFFAATVSGPWMYQSTLESGVRPSDQQLKFGLNCVMQKDNDRKDTNKSTMK